MPHFFLFLSARLRLVDLEFAIFHFLLSFLLLFTFICFIPSFHLFPSLSFHSFISYFFCLDSVSLGAPVKTLESNRTPPPLELVLGTLTPIPNTKHIDPNRHRRRHKMYGTPVGGPGGGLTNGSSTMMVSAPISNANASVGSRETQESTGSALPFVPASASAPLQTQTQGNGGAPNSPTTTSSLSTSPLSPNPFAGHPPPPSNAAIEQIIASAMALAGTGPRSGFLPSSPLLTHNVQQHQQQQQQPQQQSQYVPRQQQQQHQSQQPQQFYQQHLHSNSPQLQPPTYPSQPPPLSHQQQQQQSHHPSHNIPAIPVSLLPIPQGPPPKPPSGAVIGTGVFNYPPNRANQVLGFHPAAVGADGRVNLFVGNLPYRVRWQDVKDLFRRAGTVLRADVSLDMQTNRSRGHGSVLMGSREDGIKAIEMFNGYNWQTRILEVRPDRLPPEYEPHPHVSMYGHLQAPMNAGQYQGPPGGAGAGGGGGIPSNNRGPTMSSQQQLHSHNTLQAPPNQIAHFQSHSSTNNLRQPFAPDPSLTAAVDLGSRQPVAPSPTLSIKAPIPVERPSKDPWSDAATTVSPAQSHNSPHRPHESATAPTNGMDLAGKKSISPIGSLHGSSIDRNRSSSSLFQDSQASTRKLSSSPFGPAMFSASTPAASSISASASLHTTGATGSIQNVVADSVMKNLRGSPDNHLGLRQSSAVSLTSLTNALPLIAAPEHRAPFTQLDASVSSSRRESLDVPADEQDAPIAQNAAAFASPTRAVPMNNPGQYDSIGGRLLQVGNLPFQMQWQDLKDLFRTVGNVIRADIALGPDGRSKGHGTVLYASEADAMAAVMRFEGVDYNGRVLMVRQDWQQRQTQPPMQMSSTGRYTGGLPPTPMGPSSFSMFGTPASSEVYASQMPHDGQAYMQYGNQQKQSQHVSLTKQTPSLAYEGRKEEIYGKPMERQDSRQHPIQQGGLPLPPGIRKSTLRNGHQRPGRIALPAFPTFGNASAMSPIQTRGLPPMTPSMPGFSFQMYPVSWQMNDCLIM